MNAKLETIVVLQLLSLLKFLHFLVPNVVSPEKQTNHQCTMYPLNAWQHVANCACISSMNERQVVHNISSKKIISSVSRQKGLTGYCFKYIDRPFCLKAYNMHSLHENIVIRNLMCLTLAALYYLYLDGHRF